MGGLDLEGGKPGQLWGRRGWGRGGGVLCVRYVPDGRVLGPALLKALGEEDEGAEELKAAAHGSFVVVVGQVVFLRKLVMESSLFVGEINKQSLAREENGKNQCLRKRALRFAMEKPSDIAVERRDFAWARPTRTCGVVAVEVLAFWNWNRPLASPQRAPSAKLETRQGREGRELEIQGANHCHCFVHRQGGRPQPNNFFIPAYP